MGRVRLSIYATIYGCVYLSALGWSIWGFDPALVTFLYESPPGALIQTMRFFSSLWFAYACWTTVRSNPQKRKFYAIFSYCIQSQVEISSAAPTRECIVHRERGSNTNFTGFM